MIAAIALVAGLAAPGLPGATRSTRSVWHRRARASAYGPHLYGNTTFCGQTLRTGSLWVAHKTLPCGAKVKICHKGKCATLRVRDRGPFVSGRTFDITEGATKRYWGANATQWGIRYVRWKRVY